MAAVRHGRAGHDRVHTQHQGHNERGLKASWPVRRTGALPNSVAWLAGGRHRLYWRGEGDDLAHPWTDLFPNSPDHTALSGRVATLR
jgi:hypothetical protein